VPRRRHSPGSESQEQGVEEEARNKGIDFGTEQWGAYDWTIPVEISDFGNETTPVVSTSCLIRVQAYNDADLFDMSDGLFSITSTAVSGRSTAPASGRSIRVGDRLIRVSRSSFPLRVTAHEPSGRRVAWTQTLDGGRSVMPAHNLPAGVWIVRIEDRFGTAYPETAIHNGIQ
jgi:hypothetical protein